MSDDGTTIKVDSLGCLVWILLGALLVFLISHGGELADAFIRWCCQ